jgi:hypothetical protein
MLRQSPRATNKKPPTAIIERRKKLPINQMPGVLDDTILRTVHHRPP